MKRLIETALLYGNLYHVNGDAMVARYNRCLDALGIAPTALEDFYVDGSGFSPEIAHEKGDEQYLDPKGVNRHFIILSPEQRYLPVVKAHFSADIYLLRRFMDANMACIERVTLNDAMYGEMENMIVRVNKPIDVVGMKAVKFIVHTPSGILEAADDLRGMIQTFEEDDVAWRQPGFMAGMLDKVRVCGDIRRNHVACEEVSFDWPDIFWTDHFGGAYVFREDVARQSTTMFFKSEIPENLPSSITGYLFSDVSDALSVLSQRRLLEDMNPRSVSEDILRHKIAMRVAHVFLKNGIAFDADHLLRKGGLGTSIYAHLDVLEADDIYRYLTEVRRIMSTDGDIEAFDNNSGAAESFSILRGLPDMVDCWEVNRFVSEFQAWDVVSLFAVNKEGFYARYAQMTDAEKDFAITAITRIYNDGSETANRLKAEFRVRIYGRPS